jgi:hypothetical protein
MSMIVCLVIMMIMMAASYLMMQSTSGDNQRPTGVDDMDFPTATAGKEIVVVFGTRWVNSPNVVWYGDVRTRPIRSSGGK